MTTSRLQRWQLDTLRWLTLPLAFREKESPTLIRDLRRGRVFSTGEVVVEAGTGRVRRAVLRRRQTT